MVRWRDLMDGAGRVWVSLSNPNAYTQGVPTTNALIMAFGNAKLLYLHLDEVSAD